MGRGYSTLETDDKEALTNEETGEMGNSRQAMDNILYISHVYRGVLPIYMPNILICLCTYSTYCIVLCTWNSHTLGLYEIRSLLMILCDPTGLAPSMGQGLQCSSEPRGRQRNRIRPPQAKCIRTDRHTDSQKQGDHWQSGDTEIKTRLYERRNRRRMKSRRGIEIFKEKRKRV